MSPTSRQSRQVRGAIRRSLCLMFLVGLLAGPARAAAAADTSACQRGWSRLCLLGRFEVEATWRDGGGRDRAALALPLPSSNTGVFSFFGSEDADLLVRVVDSRRQDGRPTIEAGSAAGVGFELRVRDTVSGAEWIDTYPRGSAAGPLVAAVLEAGGGDYLGADLAKGASDCLASATDLCFLDGRFRVTAKYTSGDRQDEAWATAGGGETGLYSASERGDAELLVRVVDARALNGYIWLLYSALSSTELEIEIADLATGNSRRFVKAAGGPASEAAIEALSASAAVVNVTVDAGRAVTRAIGTAGGAIAVVDAQGTRFQVAFPAGALNLTTDVTVTPVVAIAGLPLSGGLRGAVRIEPEGVVPARTVRLTITPAPVVPVAQHVTFAFRGLAGELFLAPPLVASTTLVIPVHRLGGYGLAAGTAADLTAQLARLPTREEDRFSQQLAGLLLPSRRAATTAVPASVAPLLQAEFNARIKPRLSAIRRGDVAKHYAMLKNWSLSARDTGLVKHDTDPIKKPPKPDTVAMLEAQVKAAVIEGARRDLQLNADACIGRKDRKAMARAFAAFAELNRESAVTAGDAEKIKRCVRFELMWDTKITGEQVHGVLSDVATTRVQLGWDQGLIFGTNLVGQVLTFNFAECTTTLLSTPNVTLTVHRLDAPALNFSEDDLADLRMKVYYDLLPGLAQARWQITCPGDDGPPLNTTTAWIPLYRTSHFDEMEGELIGARLDPRPGPEVYGAKTYERTGEYYTELTRFILRHTPK